MSAASRSSGLLLALAFSCVATDATAHPDQPYVSQGMFSTYDVASLKSGEWVEYEEVVMEEPSRTRLACVAVEEDVAWIEYSGPILSFFWPDTILRFAVSRKDKLITRALWGKPGEAGKEIRVTVEEKVAETAASERTGTGAVSEQTLKIKEKEIKCEKVALDYKHGESRFIHRYWTSSEIPFRFTPPMKHLSELKWYGKATFPGGLVKRETENPANGKVTEFVVVGWGKDAKGKLTGK